MYNLREFYGCTTVADPDFPLRGAPTRWGGRPLMHTLFDKNVCENERNGSCWGGGTCLWCPPRIRQCTNIRQCIKFECMLMWCNKVNNHTENSQKWKIIQQWTYVLPSILFLYLSPLRTSNHNAFYNFLLVYIALHTLDKMDRNRLLKNNTSLEAVTLIEESDNEVFKLLNYEYT